MPTPIKSSPRRQSRAHLRRGPLATACDAPTMERDDTAFLVGMDADAVRTDTSAHGV